MALDHSPDLFAYRFYVLVLFFCFSSPTCERLSWLSSAHHSQLSSQLLGALWYSLIWFETKHFFATDLLIQLELVEIIRQFDGRQSYARHRFDPFHAGQHRTITHLEEYDAETVQIHLLQTHVNVAFCVTTYPVQIVCAGVRLPERNSTGILARPDSVCRQYRTSSATLSVDLWFHGTTNTSGINRGPCVRRCRSTSVEQSTASPPLNLQIPLFLQKRT